MIANWLTTLGVTRDSALWLWSQLAMAAALITSGVVDVVYWAHYLAIPVTLTQVHWIQVVAILVLWLSGRYSSSPLPGAAKK